MYINKKLINKIFIYPFVARILEDFLSAARRSELAKRLQAENRKRGFDEVSIVVRAR